METRQSPHERAAAPASPSGQRGQASPQIAGPGGCPVDDIRIHLTPPSATFPGVPFPGERNQVTAEAGAHTPGTGNSVPLPGERLENLSREEPDRPSGAVLGETRLLGLMQWED